MCGRYQCWIEDEELTAIIEREKKGNAERYLRRQEVYPGDGIPVLYGGGYFLRSKIVVWGYPLIQQQEGRPMEMTAAGAVSGDDSMAYPREKSRGRLVINARAETAMEKRMFRDDMVNRRVAIPASGYYEWDEGGQKHRVEKERRGILYLAAMTHVFPEGERAVILTVPSSLAVQHIHPRMPLILGRHEVEDWLYNDYFSRHKLQDRNYCLLETTTVS